MPGCPDAPDLTIFLTLSPTKQNLAAMTNPPHTQRPDAPNGIRLAKRVAEMVPCSRSDAEQYIALGWVTVDGVVMEEPQFRVAHQRVQVSPDASLLGLGEVTLVLHKPAGFEALLLPSHQFSGDRSGTRPLKKHLTASEFVTPLALPASGLVVFTQDWRVARKLREDSATLEHEVVVDVTGEVKPGGLDRLNRIDHGFTLNGVLLSPAKVSFQSEARLRFALKNEKPGQIAFMCESVGLQVTAMKRLRIGRVPLSDLPVGQWRYLMPHERF